jgi:hypothetical protein
MSDRSEGKSDVEGEELDSDLGKRENEGDDQELGARDKEDSESEIGIGGSAAGSEDEALDEVDGD